MKQRRQMTALVLALAVLAALLHMQGCAHEYDWYKWAQPAARYQWITVAPSVMFSMCGSTKENYPNLGGCAFYAGNGGDCYVYSKYTEFAAQRVMSGDGITLFEHEVWNEGKTVGHCAGFRHAQA